MPKEAYWFSHDSNARNDIKIKAMISKYGYEGYGMYWAIIEMLRETSDFKLPMEDYTFLALQQEFNGCSTDVQQFVNDCVTTFKLFKSDDNAFWSDSLKRRMALKEMKREQARKAGKASAEKRRNINGSERSYNVSSTDVEQNLTDVQQRKEKKRKERKDIYSADADFLWGLYPEKKGKKDAMAKLPKLIDQYGKDQVERCIKRYLADVDKRRKSGFADLRYKNGSTFFKSGYMDYLDENVPEEKPEPVKKPSGRNTVSLLELVRAKEERERHGQGSGS
jgi:hypothetical protein